MSEKKQELTETKDINPVPNEQGGFYFSSFLKITDPNTKEVLVETRGDN